MINIATYTTKAGLTAQNVSLVIASISCNPLGHSGASTRSRFKGFAGRTKLATKPATKSDKAKSTKPVLTAGAIPIRGQLAVYPTASIPTTGFPDSPPVETIPFAIPDAASLPSGSNLLTQVYAALMLQTQFKGGTLV